MKQVVQEIGRRDVSVVEMDLPAIPKNWYLVKVHYSCISPGTESMLRTFASDSIVIKAKKRPDLVKKVVKKFQQEGFQNTFSLVKSKLGRPIPLGYSCVGEIVQSEIGSEFKTGDMVACAGAGISNHAEFIAVPPRLCCKIPEGCDVIAASIATLAAISLQGFREAEMKIGETALVLGGGALGSILADICKSSSIDVTLFEPNLERANTLSINHQNCFSDLEDLRAHIKNTTGSFGVDAVFICASSKDNAPILEAINNIRDFGRMIILGSLKTDIPRDEAYKKSLRVIYSRSYGPGRHDDTYENMGIDYPREFVRFPIQRNMETTLKLIRDKKINMELPVYPLADASEAYADLDSNRRVLGAVFDCSAFPKRKEFIEKGIVYRKEKELNFGAIKDSYKLVWEKYSKNPQICLVGPGEFALGVLVPGLKSIKLPLTAFVSRDSARSLLLKKSYPEALGMGSIEEAIEKKPDSAFLISNRHSEHFECIKKTLTAGRLTFVEKPLCISQDEFLELQAIIEKTGNVPFVGHNRRFSGLIQDLVLNLRKISGPLHLVYRVHAGLLPPGHWVTQEKEGGRVLGEITHFIDLIRYLVGKKMTKACPFGDFNCGFEFEDGSSAVLSYVQTNDSQMEKEIIEVHTGGKTFSVRNFHEVSGFKSSHKGKGHKEELDFIFKQPNLSAKLSQSLDMIESHKIALHILSSIQE